MPHPEHLCSHLNEIVDDVRGEIVCMDCGLVLCEKLFKHFSQINKYVCKENEKEKEKENDVNEILEKLNLPNCFTNSILDNYKTNRNAKKKEFTSFAIYNTLNKEGFPVSIKEISAVSGYTDSEIYNMQENETIMLDPHSILEKYCNILGIDYKTYSVIKTGLPTTFESGHTPQTIVASTIYCYFKRYFPKKYPMKIIAKTVHTSCISIQRYLKKNELSFRL